MRQSRYLKMVVGREWAQKRCPARQHSPCSPMKEKMNKLKFPKVTQTAHLSSPRLSPTRLNCHMVQRINYVQLFHKEWLLAVQYNWCPVLCVCCMTCMLAKIKCGGVGLGWDTASSGSAVTTVAAPSMLHATGPRCPSTAMRQRQPG